MTLTPPLSPQTDEDTVRSTFDKFWIDQTDLGEIDDTCEDILRLLEQEFPRIGGASFLEVGSGSGRISVVLARRGAHVTLLDNSETAISISKELFSRHGQEATFVLDSAFDMPLPDNSFDVVWNAGVLEHFLFDDQVRMLQEMLRVLKPEGTLMTFNPSHDGRIYRLGKFLRERTGSGRSDAKSRSRRCGRMRIDSVRSSCTSSTPALISSSSSSFDPATPQRISSAAGPHSTTG